MTEVPSLGSNQDPSTGRPWKDVQRILFPGARLPFILWMGATYTDTRSQAVESSPTRVDTVMRDTLDSSVLIDDSVAMDTLSKLKIFCWITTKETEVNKKIPAVNETWVKRCDHRMFVMTTNKPNTGMDILNLNIKDGRQHLTEKSIASLKHIYKHHLDKYDWFLKADDDTFVVMENLKFLLSHYDPTEGVYVGHLFKKYTKWGYMSGGAGYVISRPALRLLVEQGYNKNDPSTGRPWKDVQRILFPGARLPFILWMGATYTDTRSQGDGDLVLCFVVLAWAIGGDWSR
ncbi:glycoprotein-N-acetylgalactosamine 3-beta-galactosyltransferase 1-like [Haliotis cracherodii]|uniref:glycoprotein-N-acetylgalactosamine 3-beta-galactosyltransferase 1-like n=1 Tax=Haliotis cracherodii TaxID=6455 RepID=UPI0039ED54A9